MSADPGQSARVTLSWAGVQRAQTLSLVGDTTGPVDLSGQPVEAGSVEVEVFEDTVFTLIAANAAGQVSATTQVRVVPYPVVDSLVAAPRHVAPGEPFILSWATTNATSISLTANGVPVFVSPWQVDGSLQLQILADTTFVLRAANDVGDLVEESVTVTVGPPEVLSFAAIPDYAPAGET